MFDLWSASSIHLDVGEGAIKNNISYYIKGTKSVVNHIHLALNVLNPEQADAAEEVFFAKAATLLKAAIPGQIIKLDTSENSLTVKHWHVSLDRQDWGASTGGHFELALTVEVLPPACPDVSQS